MAAPAPRRAPLSPVSLNSAPLSSPESHGTPVKRVLQARTFSPDVDVKLPPTPSPHKSRFSASPSPAKQPSGLASDLAKSKLYMRMQQTCKTPETSPHEGDAAEPQRAHETPPEMPPADSLPPTPLIGASTPSSEAPSNLGASGGGATPSKTPGSTPGWDGTPARRLREEASKLRNMSRLNSPALASSRRSLECKNAVGDELARTRSQLAAAEEKVRLLETPSDHGSSHGRSSRRQSATDASDLLSFDDSPASTPTAARIGSNIPRLSTGRSSEASSRPAQAATTGASISASSSPASSGGSGAVSVTVTVRVLNDPLAPARQVTLQPSSSRAGSVLAQLKKAVAAFEGGKVIVRATARGWERVSKADELSVRPRLLLALVYERVCARVCEYVCVRCACLGWTVRSSMI
jgi:hypothetical protein